VLRWAGIVLMAGIAAGCAGMSEQIADAAFVSPGKFDAYSCRQIADQIRGAQYREREFRQLMERAAQSPGGEFVNTIAYRSDYFRVRADLKLLQATATGKNCTSQSEWQSERSVW
jgi:hypothetical protein